MSETIKFYDALQLDPSVLKHKIAVSNTRQEKLYYWTAMTLRSILIVGFAILLISLLSALFGSDNTPMAVVLFCMMLGIRFVNFEYCIRDSLITLAVALAILVCSPALATVLPEVLLIPFHFSAFFSLLYITTQKPEMGNGGLYSFAYIYLCGNPVSGEALLRRGWMAFAGYLVCGLILVIKHRHRHTATGFHHILKKFSLSSPLCLWQLRMALGISLILSIGQILSVTRFMWMGFACASLLSEYPYTPNTRIRFRQRIIGAIAGSLAFLFLSALLPESLHPLIGPLGGLCLGFCTDYRYKTAMNCLGALMIGSGIYGVQTAVALRILHTVSGVCFALIFALVFHHLAGARLLSVPEKNNFSS